LQAQKKPVETGWNVRGGGGRPKGLRHRATTPQRAALTARLGRARPLEAAFLCLRLSGVIGWLRSVSFACSITEEWRVLAPNAAERTAQSSQARYACPVIERPGAVAIHRVPRVWGRGAACWGAGAGGARYARSLPVASPVDRRPRAKFGPGGRTLPMPPVRVICCRLSSFPRLGTWGTRPGRTGSLVLLAVLCRRRRSPLKGLSI